MNIVILAAGMGKRMRSDLPKVLHPIGGKPLLGHVLDCSRSLSPGRLVVVHGHGAEQVRERLSAPDVHWALQEPQLGTGHAVRQALPALDESQPTLILSGDVPLIRPTTLLRLLAAAGTDKLGVLTVELPDPTGYGRIVRQERHIVGIVEHKDADENTRAIREINTGIMVAPTTALKRWLAGLSNDNSQREYYLTDIVAAAVLDGVPVVSAQPDAPWETEGVNSRTQLAALERRHQLNLAHALTEAGVTLIDPARIDIRGTLRCGQDVTIDVNCVFIGDVVLEDRVSVAANCVLENTTVGAGTELLPFIHTVDTTIGAGARVGPFSRLRPGTRLGDGTHVGNFVEMKAARLGKDSKANHLSYVGDTIVGERVNIGAGTITCNYDGANKHLTIIEDDVHIGSDTQLVAPVKVGARATVAAGTTVWQEVPPDTLVLNPRQQSARAGWKRPVKLKKPAQE
jgi:bifunctional UDP-N-acetylglucosamine pyrophosphorylase/glucosamine-1-phosphate N-acetyltransferase